MLPQAALNAWAQHAPWPNDLDYVRTSNGPIKEIMAALRGTMQAIGLEQAIFTSLLIAQGVVPGPGVGNMPPELDMVEPGWVRLTPGDGG